MNNFLPIFGGEAPWYKSASYKADGISPSLIMDFKNNRYYSNGSARALSDLLTFTRASTATYIRNGVVYSAAVNEARIGTNGLLMEMARTNLATYNQQFDNAAWTKSNATITANAATAPDGTATADLLVESATTATHEVSQAFTVTAANVYTVSVFAKTNGRHLQIGFGTDTTPNNSYANFDLSAGTVGNDSTGTARIQALSNGWYRCSITVTTAGTSLRPYIHMITNSAAGWNQSYAGDGTSGIYPWGIQVELGQQMSSYIPTTTAAVTRSVDEAISTTVSDYLTRASTAYYRNASGVMTQAAINEPRWNYQYGSSTPSLLREGAATNICPNNSNPSLAASWAGNSAITTVSSAGTAPDGGASYQIVETATNAMHYISNNGGTGGSVSGEYSFTSGQTWTLSSFLKKGSLGSAPDWVQLTGGSSAFGLTPYANFNLSTGAIGNYSGCTPTIENYGGGWYRCGITLPTTATATANTLTMAFTNNTNAAGRFHTSVAAYTGSTSADVYMWGFQAEQASAVSSIIPTAGAAVTRSADSVATGAQAWMQHLAGTALYKYFYDVLQVTNDTTNFTIGSGIGTNYITSWENKTTGYPTARYVEATTQIDVTAASGLRTNADNIGAIAYAANNGAVAFNGSTPTTDATVTLASSGITQFNIGSATARASVGARGTREYPFFAFYPARISNSELTRITT